QRSVGSLSCVNWPTARQRPHLGGRAENAYILANRLHESPVSDRDNEANRFTARARRYARVGTNMSGVAARFAAARMFGLDLDRDRNAAELAAALGGLKGPIMKVAQLMATIPDLLPPAYAPELATPPRAP